MERSWWSVGDDAAARQPVPGRCGVVAVAPPVVTAVGGLAGGATAPAPGGPLATGTLVARRGSVDPG